MHTLVKQVSDTHKKAQVVDVKSGDVVRVHQKIQEGSKTRVQVFEGLVIRTDRKDSLTSRITVRRIASGVGVEKSFLLHSPLVVKVEVVKRSNVRRNYLSYMRNRTGKSARLAGVDFDKEAVNTIEQQQAEDLGVSAEEAVAAEKPKEEAVEEKAEKTEAKAEKPAAEEKIEAKTDEKSEKSTEELDKAAAKKAKAEAFRQAQEAKNK